MYNKFTIQLLSPLTILFHLINTETTVGILVHIYNEPSDEMNFLCQFVYLIVPNGMLLNDLLIQERYIKATRN